MQLGPIPRGLEGEIAVCRLGDEEVGMLVAGGPRDQADAVIHHMERAGFAVERHALPGHTSWDDTFDANEIDILVAGDHPEGADACVEFARRVIHRNPLIDVLVYGMGEIEPRTRHDRSLYTKIWTHRGTDYAAEAIDMIDTCRRKWSDMIFLRGMVVSQIVDVEAHINGAIAAHFGMEPSTPRGRQFEEYVLENPMYMLEGKKQALGRILRDMGMYWMWKGMGNRISNLQAKRNKVAHCEVDPDDTNAITSMGKTYRYGRSEMRSMLRDARLVRQRLLDITDAILEDRPGAIR